MQDNGAGALAARLSTDAAIVHQTTGPRLGLQLQNFSSLAVALGIAFYSSWQLTLVVLGIVPLMALSGVAVMRFVKGNDKDASFLAAGAISTEAITNIRTVTSFGLQEKLVQLFDASLNSGTAQGDKAHWATGAMFGLSQLSMFGANALVFWTGAKFIEKGCVWCCSSPMTSESVSCCDCYRPWACVVQLDFIRGDVSRILCAGDVSHHGWSELTNGGRPGTVRWGRCVARMTVSLRLRGCRCVRHAGEGCSCQGEPVCAD